MPEIEGLAPPLGNPGSTTANTLYWSISLKNCIEMKNIESRGGVPGAPSLNLQVMCIFNMLQYYLLRLTFQHHEPGIDLIKRKCSLEILSQTC